MTRSMHPPILLVGVGLMSLSYAKVLKDLRVEYLALGRGEASARSFHDATGVKPTTGFLTEQLRAISHVPDTAIVVVNAMYLTEVAIMLMEHGVKQLLLEKPAALDGTELNQLMAACAQHDADIRVGYNRRFMQSAIVARQMIEEDGGVSGVKFDFSEPSRRIVTLDKPKRELTTWFYGNSSHVVDLAFHFFGAPSSMEASIGGHLDWHPVAARFVGTATKASGAFMSWHANWVGPGRWGIEVMTTERRLILQPLEKLRVQSHDGFAEFEIEIDDAEDLEFKPGIRKQVCRFLFGDGPDVLPSLRDHHKMFQYYEVVRTGGRFLRETLSNE